MFTAVDFVRDFDTFKGLPQEDIQKRIDDSYVDNPLKLWGTEELRDRAVKQLVAHRLRIERADHFAQGATLKSIKENEEIKIPLLDLSKPYHKQTIYGLEYLRLKKNKNGGSLR